MKITIQNIAKNKLDKLNTNFKGQTNPIEQKQYSVSSLNTISNYNKASLNMNFNGNIDSTKEDIEEFKKQLLSMKDNEGRARFNKYDINSLTSKITPENKDVIKELINAKDYNGKYRFSCYNISYNAEFITDKNKDGINYLVNFKNNDGSYRFDENVIFSIIRHAPNGFWDELDENINKIDAQKQKMFAHPALYVNGEYNNENEMSQAIEWFFDTYAAYFLLFSYAFDKETLDNLFRKRFFEVMCNNEFIGRFNPDSIQLLKDLCNSSSIYNKPFLPEQKIGLLNLIYGFEANHLGMSKMRKMAKTGIVDTAQLNLDLFRGVLKKCGLDDDEISKIPLEKLLSWDIEYTHLLAQEIEENEDSTVFNHLLKAANLGDFNKFIQDDSNIYGQTNANTKDMFDKYNLNYAAWLKPLKENNVQFKTKDKNQEQLSQIAMQLVEDIETLRQTPAKGFVDKQFVKYIKDDKFFIPTQYITSKAKFKGFITNLTKQLQPIFKRAKGNLNNPQKTQNAQNTLTIQDHLNQRLDDVSKINNSKSQKTKNLDLTIKMWDRIPQKDIFQGNYSTCCIGMGGANGSAMPHYLMNSAYNMIEIVDNNTNKTIGNALCYFVTDENNKPCLIIDNIEINNSNSLSKDVGIELRNAIVEYATNITKDVAGNDDTKIYMSSKFNDVPIDDLNKTQKRFNFLGDIECDSIYMDSYNGWVDKSKLRQRLNALKLR